MSRMIAALQYSTLLHYTLQEYKYILTNILPPLVYNVGLRQYVMLMMS